MVYVFTVFQAEFLEDAFFQKLSFFDCGHVATNGVRKAKGWHCRIDHVTALGYTVPGFFVKRAYFASCT